MTDLDDAFMAVSKEQDEWWLRLDDLVWPRYGIGAKHLDGFGIAPQTPSVRMACQRAMADPAVCSFMGIVIGLRAARRIMVGNKPEWDLDAARLGLVAH